MLAIGAGLAIYARGAFLTWLDPSWRMTGALLTAGAAICTAAWFWLEGGWPLLRRQCFSLAFGFLALPWPKGIETAVTNRLLHTITSWAVVFLNLCGIVATQQGNLILLHAHEVGMETACSGIESLQAALMAAIFLGELHLLRASRRLLLVAGAVVLAMGLNFARVSALASLTEFSGPEITAHYHDAIGATATAALFLLLVLFAGLAAEPEAPARARTEPSNSLPPPAWSGWAAAGAVCAIWLAGVMTLTRPATADNDPNAHIWNVDAARLPAGWTAQPDALTALDQTRLQRHEERWHIQSPDAGEAYVIYLRWKPGTQSEATSYPHSPGLCLPTQGWQPVGGARAMAIPGASKPVPFDSYQFTMQSARLTALQCLSSGKTYLPTPAGEKPALGQRFLNAFYHRPSYVSEDLLIYLPEPASEGNVTRMVSELVQAYSADRS